MLRLSPAVEKFSAAIPETALADLQARLALTRFPAEPDDAAWQYGSNTGYMRRFIARWREGFDWRQWEAKLNAYPQYRVALKRPDTQSLQTVHVLIEPGSGPAPRPLLMTHGWPGSVFEFLEAIPRLAHPERYGGRVEDAFTVICPTLPGYGFSMPISRPIGPRAIAKLWRDLMVEALGVDRFLVQAGDFGSIVSSWLGVDHAEHVAAMHLNMVPLRPAVTKDSPPLSEAEKQWAARTKKQHARETGYLAIQSTKPSTLGHALSDSPVGLAAWFVEKFHGFTRGPSDQMPPFEIDHLIANVAFYWLTDTATTATWLYWAARETGDFHLKPGEFVTPPTGFLLVPWDLTPPPPPGWLERGYHVTHRRDLDSGGHFVAMEQPDIFVADVQAFFRNAVV